MALAEPLLRGQQPHPGEVAVPAADLVAGSASCLYRGWVRHRRHGPRAHEFRQSLTLLYMDLAELTTLFRQRWLWSVERGNLACFRRRDYLGPTDLPLDEAVRQRFMAASGRRPEGPIRLLSQIRQYGFVFNPVSFYYCFKADGIELEGIIAEITNTPWKERHAYVLDCQAAEDHRNTMVWRFDKRFHVSPFLPMDRQYRWAFQPPGETLRLHMDALDGSRRQFDASLVLERKELTTGSLTRCLLAFPGSSARVWLGIHWQAFLIWCKRNPFYAHPRYASKPRAAEAPPAPAPRHRPEG